MTIVIAILIFGFLIFIHELGHYTTARIFKVKVNEFAIGMGPKILSKTSGKTGIAYSWRLLPIGGFVSMAGEDEESEDENALYRKPAWQRFIIMIAGSFMNILLGVILVFVMVVSSEGLYGTTVEDFVDNAYTEQSGLRVGDKIVKVGKHSTHTLYDLAYGIMEDGDEPVDVVVIRGGEKMKIPDVVFPTETESGIKIGLRDFYVDETEFDFVNVIKQTVHRSDTTVRMVWESLINLIKGKYGVDDLSGPVGVTKTISDAASDAKNDGGESLLYLVSLIAINLGVFNLLPFPALDGFRAFTLIIEWITGKSLNKEVEGYINFAGLALMMLLMIFVTFSDVVKLF